MTNISDFPRSGTAKNRSKVAPSDGAKEIAEDIRQKIRSVSGCDIGPKAVDLSTATDILDRVFWWPARQRLFLLDDGALKEVSKPEVALLLRKTFGAIVNPSAMQEAIVACDDNANAPNVREKKKGQCIAAPAEAVLNYSICRRQCNRIDWSVDMFADRDRVEIDGNAARVILTHRPFDEGFGYEEAIVEDYKKHFPRFDKFLEFLLACRFASCRKTGYLWLFADSDWGKNLLIEGILGGLRDGVIVNLSVKEIESIFEGQPAGKPPESFTHALALVVNEFKAVKAELKQIENTISIAPKYQMASKVPVYAKIFLSAENVESLVTQNGVEDQFANRINLFEERGNIKEREKFKEVGKERYVRNVRDYAAAHINKKIVEYQFKGRLASTEAADKKLEEFFNEYTIGKTHEKFSETLPRVAQDCIDWIHQRYGNCQQTLDNVDVLIKASKEETYYLRNPSKHIDAFLEAHYPRGEVQSYRRRRTEIAQHMSIDGKGLSAHWVDDKTIKAIKLKPKSDEGKP